jgi:thiol-disulfide isomerase/thioredoxin
VELVKSEDARNAVDALLDGKPVPVEQTGVFGCSTKWKEKLEARIADQKKIDAEPVRLDLATAEDLQKLRANATGKMLLVSFWATWCGPCTAELPEFQKMYRMYRKRAFDLVTVSVNFPDESKGVLKFLNQQHASTKNLIFATNETYDEMAAFDPGWNAAVPYTVLIGIDGNVLYQKQGEIDPLEVRRLILANLPDDDYIGQQAYWNSK